MDASRPKDGGSIYPESISNMHTGEHFETEYGLVIRDYFAAAIITGMMADPNGTFGVMGHEARAEYAFAQADAMLEKR